MNFILGLVKINDFKNDTAHVIHVAMSRHVMHRARALRKLAKQHIGLVAVELTWRRCNSYRCLVTPFFFT